MGIKMAWFLYLVIGLQLYFHNAYKVVRDEDNVLYLVYPKRGIAAVVPDEKTLVGLKLDHVPISTVTKSFLKAFKLENTALPSLNMHISTRDDAMRYEVLKILSLSPPIFWKDTYYLGKMLNPALESWKGRTFFTWRNGMYDSPINFAWFSFEEMIKRKHIVNSRLLQNPNAKDYPYFDSIISLSIKEYDFNHLQEDPRLLVRANGSLAIIYTVKESLFKPPKQAYCHLSMTTDAQPPQLTVTNSILLDGHAFDPSQKNWIALEHGQDMYFIQSVNPLVVLKHDGSNGSDPRIGKVRIVHQDSQTITLPWRNEYGAFIRGGSPAVLVTPNHPAHQQFPKYYLAFFHSVAQIQERNSLRTYFMGAVSFCPHPPFHIHAISTHPILQEKFYDGAWVEPRRTDYVMFAIGSLMRPDDPNHIYVSFGHQDKDGYLAKFHLGELFASMEIVNNCSENS
jgi:hypothetical protein